MTYAWTGPGGFTSGLEDPSGLDGGLYTVIITDGGGCLDTLSVTVNEPAALVLTNTSANSSCNGDNDGSINLTITGGSGSYSVNWTGPNSYTSTLEDINGLLAGVYNVTVTDDSGNQSTCMADVTVEDNIPPVAICQDITVDLNDE